MTHHTDRFAELITRLGQYSPRRLEAVASAMDWIESLCGNEEQDVWRKKVIQSGSKRPHSMEVKESKDWPRAPLHRLEEKGTFIVTGGTYGKLHHFRDAEALDHLEAELLRYAKEYGWQLESWAVFSNHYHFVAHALEDAKSLGPMLKRLHSETGIWINERDNESKRQVWYNFWDTKLTYPKSYQARLHYVHRNPVHHGLVRVANQYRWCSAAWFERTATPAQVKTIYSFKTDQIKVIDDFEPLHV